MPSPEEVFQRLQPWITEFLIDGQPHGGDYQAWADPRLEQFQQAAPKARRILELGSLEGGHSFELARRAQEVVALEARSQNIERAQAVRSLLGIENVRFHQVDLEQSALAVYGEFDAIFCVGVLYHLSRPWELVWQMADLSPLTFLWTHYTERSSEVRLGYEGSPYREFGLQDPLSGTTSESFWPSLGTLERWWREAGFDLEVLEQGRRNGSACLTAVARRSTMSP